MHLTFSSSAIPIPGRREEEYQTLEIPSEIRNEDNDFLYEIISILNRIGDTNDEKTKSFEMTLEDKRDSYSILYSLLALILVSKAKEDVAAVTVCQKRDSITMYYAKNDLTTETIAHVDITS
jgi:hypothetical protein